MVPSKITCPSRSDDIGNLSINSNTKRYGFFPNESQDSKYFESGRHRSFKGKQGTTDKRPDRSDCRRKFGIDANTFNGRSQLLRGKNRVDP
ncbi:unnamed protein product [Diatraea saccharalis]|uniref:Uncharacterized protein n=1 Tax=Diatraea saccharalis TaxID=40085 RepID=A0A9N9WDD0_9NEOP|nr:unnamed protein product [Diatraea saccharalis]